MNVEWRQIPGLAKGYEASKCGRIRNARGKVLKARKGTGGLLVNAWREDGKAAINTVHSLVYRAWVDPKTKYAGVYHINGDVTDNRVTNILGTVQGDIDGRQISLRTSMPGEMWAELDAPYDYISISNAGRVHSQLNGYLTGSICRKGYTHLIIGGKKVSVHSLVMDRFVGSRPKGALIRHLDDQPSNNRLSNLAYGTHADNAADLKKNGKHLNSKDKVTRRKLFPQYCVNAALSFGG